MGSDLRTEGDATVGVYQSKTAREFDQKGLTKREYFAAKALNGLISSVCDGKITLDQLVDLASASVDCADELIDQLNKPRG